MIAKIRNLFTKFYYFVMNHIPSKIGRVTATLFLVPMIVVIHAVIIICAFAKMVTIDTFELCQEAWDWNKGEANYRQ